MEPAIESHSRSWQLRKCQLIMLAMIVSMASLAMVFVAWRYPGAIRTHRQDPVSPYMNTGSGVKYVGDDACVGCHARATDSYRQHPMGRSVAPIGVSDLGKRIEGAGRALFENQGLEYSIEQRNGRVFHLETRRDASGRIIVRNEAEIQFAVGSGRQGTSYLIEHDGFLFESPLTWYARKERWDLSPGFEPFNHHFERPIQPNCLFCHTNRVQPRKGTLNQYRQPIFEGHAIGCERCHGPGELHVARPTLLDGQDRNIVNPAHLPPALREDVCAQCHLAGSARILQVGRHNDDYRPGLPFPRFWTVFVQPPDRAEDRFVGQVEQMHESRCFRASGGELSCISCHDPHHFPTPEEKPAYYRGRCLACHAGRSCSLPEGDRLVRSKNDDCAGCHMPRANSLDIPHAATSNHRIPRREGGGNPGLIRSGNNRRDRLHLLIFHRERMNAGEQAEAERDRGVALCRDGVPGARVALPLLEEALAARPDDVTAWECKGHALGGLGRLDEALAAYRKALTMEPGRESVLTEAARAAAKLVRLKDATGYWDRAIALDPWRSDYQAELASVCYRIRDWEAAAVACRQSLRLNPVSLQVRKLLVQCYLNLGDITGRAPRTRSGAGL